jgi:hypothetical protein
LERVAPGWRDSAYPGFPVLKETHPEGGAKLRMLQPLPGELSHYPWLNRGCFAPRAIRFNASGVRTWFFRSGESQRATGNSP